jgi:hypothetical protein
MVGRQNMEGEPRKAEFTLSLREWELRELEDLYRSVEKLIAELQETIPCLEAVDE